MTIENFKRNVDAACILSKTYEYQNPVLAKRGLAFGVAGEVIIGNIAAKIVVGVPEAFPNCTPTFFLLNQEDFIRLPHVEHDGYICYTHNDTLVLDIDNEPGIIAGCFELAIKTLKDGIDKKDNNEFYNEYEAYWRQLKGVSAMFANLVLGEDVEVIKYSKLKDKDKELFFAVSDTTERMNSYQRIVNVKENPAQYFNGLYIPLKKGAEILIPSINQELTLEDARELILKNVTPGNEKKIRTALSKTKQEDLIVIDFPLPNGNHSLFALRFKRINHAAHPLFTPGSTASVIPYNVKRVDPEFMLIRGGNGNSFIDKRVLVIGGGSVGSAVAEELIKAAVVNVDVVDKEKLEIDNCYRHNCGFRYVNKKKAEAIKEKLTSYYPHSNVTAINMAIEDAISKKKIDFDIYDAVVVATGNATVNQFLMKFFREEIPGKPVLFSWLDPYGVGGHCLVSNISENGCYQCLYTNEALHNIASFAAPNQQRSFVKNISGCGSVYVPYGSLDANQTAILTVRKILDVFAGKETINAAYSWKGSSELFLQEGYNLSDRYHQTAEQLEAGKSLFHQPKCKLCGKG
jgi:molybdopterin/thiamine biosynthesis adenylyltransferase